MSSIYVPTQRSNYVTQVEMQNYVASRGSSNKNYFNLILASDITGLISGSNIIFPLASTTTGGSGISYNSGTGTITLTVGSTYLFNFGLSLTWTPSNVHSQIQFVTSTGTYIGNQCIIFDNGRVLSQMSNPTINFLYTPTAGQNVINMRMVYAGAATTVRGTFSSGYIMQIV